MSYIPDQREGNPPEWQHFQPAGPFDSPPPEKPKGVWGPAATFGWCVLIFLIYAIVQSVCFVVFAIAEMQERHPDGFNLMEQASREDSELMQLTMDGTVMAPTSIWSGIIGTLIVLGFIKLKRGSRIREYLNLKMPTIKHFLIWTGILIGYLVLGEIVSLQSEDLQTDFMVNMVDGANLWMLILGIGIAAPVFEEVFFRGFFFKGFEAAGAPPAVTVGITSFFFVIIHLQYDFGVMLMLLPIALILGFSRLKTQSIWVPIWLHVLNNTLATIWTWYAVNG